MNRKDLLLLVLVLLSFGVIGGRIWAAPSLKPAVGDPAVEIHLPTHDGKTMTLSKFEGHRGVVLVFFSVNCPACLAKVPEVKAFVEQAREKNVVVFGVNLGDPKSVVDEFVGYFDTNYRILLDPLNTAGIAYDIYAIPHIVAIDADGIVRYRQTDLPRDREGLIAELTASLETEEEPPETVESESSTATTGSTGGAREDEGVSAGEDASVSME